MQYPYTRCGAIYHIEIITLIYFQPSCVPISRQILPDRFVRMRADPPPSGRNDRLCVVPDTNATLSQAESVQIVNDLGKGMLWIDHVSEMFNSGRRRLLPCTLPAPDTKSGGMRAGFQKTKGEDDP
jgi:hypothetical protein